MPVKRRMYDTEADFAKERGKLERAGWHVTSRKMVPGARWKWRWLRDINSFGLMVLLSPILLVMWLRLRNAPEEQIDVVYEREAS